MRIHFKFGRDPGGRTQGGEKVGSRPISRILSRTVIPLGRLSPVGSSNLPASSAGHAIGRLFGLAPGGVCRAIACCQGRGALLPHHFTLTCDRFRSVARTDKPHRRYLSVALSIGSRRPGVTWHPALWSPDFPPAPCGTSDCLADSQRRS